MIDISSFTRHAWHRAAERSVPTSLISLLLDYGESRDAGEGARKFAFSKTSLRHLKRDLGPSAIENLDRYRKAYVVAAEGHVITVAFARRPLFH